MLLDQIKLEPGERILIQTRRHWFIAVSEVAGLALIAIVPLGLLLFIETSIFGTLSLDVSLRDYAPLITFFYAALLSLIWITIFNVLTNHYLDILTITNRRAVLVNQKGFFWRNVASFRLERMQDMNIEVNGLLATMLDYGTIEVETASNTEDEFRATFIPNPSHLKSKILQAADNLISHTPQHDGIDPIEESEVAKE